MEPRENATYRTEQCRRHAPISTVGMMCVDTIWPTTQGNDWCGEFERMDAPSPDPQSLYNELLYAVATKHEGETRHATALRYIRERENPAKGADASTLIK